MNELENALKSLDGASSDALHQNESCRFPCQKYMRHAWGLNIRDF